MSSEEKIPNINSIEEKQDIARQIQITNPIQNLPQNTQINDINPNALPLDVTKDLAQYSKIFVTKEYDYFKVVHFFENYLHDYKVFGELPDGDKKLLFTVSKHFECKLCCDNCIMTCCCCSYVFCNSIIFQFDYKRNGKPFFTQGLNLQSGCYCCQCYCCSCCSCCTRSSYLRLRENIYPNNPDANVGIYKGVTKATTCCIVPELTANYIKNDDSNGPGIRAKCWDVIRKRCLKCCCGLDCDFTIDIEDANGNKNGDIKIYSGCFSKKTEEHCFCYLPRPYYEINMPVMATSEQKFQIIADLVHFDFINGSL